MSTGTVWLSGATGLLGSRLTRRLRDDGHRVRRVSRRPERLPDEPGCEAAAWDGQSPDPETLRGTAAVVHLAGEPVFGGLPTKARRDRIWDSRIRSTRHLVEALSGLPDAERPSALVCASAVGYYGDRGETVLDEDSAAGEGFLATVCSEWEASRSLHSMLGRSSRRAARCTRPCPESSSM